MKLKNTDIIAICAFIVIGIAAIALVTYQKQRSFTEKTQSEHCCSHGHTCSHTHP